jgi:phosphatidylglycerol:prolipoprotein diacylglycerol transferase
LKIALLKFGPLGIHWYGLLIAAALVVGVAISAFLARERGESPGPLAGILLLGLLSGLIGARVWYFIFRRDFYNPDPGRIFAVWQGGLAWHGALLGGVLGAGIYIWNREINFWTWADICAPGLILAQAIGRVGDIMNNQAFGVPSHGLWTVTIPLANRPPQYQGFSTFTNTAGSEAVWDVLVFGALIGLWQLQRRRAPYLPAGSIFLAYLVLYSIARLPLEGFRVDSLWVMNMRVAQLASGALIVVGGLLYALRLFQGDRQPVAALTVPGPGPVLTLTGGESYLQPSAQYLIAASGGGRPRPATAITSPLPNANGGPSNRRGNLGQHGTTVVLPIVSGVPIPARQSGPTPLPTSTEPEPVVVDTVTTRSVPPVSPDRPVAAPDADLSLSTLGADATSELSSKIEPTDESAPSESSRHELALGVVPDAEPVSAAAHASSAEEV